MSDDKIKKLIEAGITKEDIKQELAKRAQAPQKKIIKKKETTSTRYNSRGKNYKT